VVDFGLAQRVHTEERERRHTVGSLQSDMVLHLEEPSGRAGTPEYMAPEQWTNLECTPQTDLWAFGVMLFELATGQLPFDEPTLLKQATAVCAAQAAPRADAVSDVPRELANLVARCLEKNAEDRPDAASVAQGLRALIGTDRVSVGGEESPFRGLLPFSERHARFFFGRDAELAAFLERMRALPVLPVVGPSGAGKSSFVQAGIIPRVREQAPSLVLRLRPGSRPFETLAMRLVRRRSTQSISLSDSPPNSEEPAVMRESAVLAARLRRSPRLLSLELRALAEEHHSDVLLYIDELEELFTLVDDDELRKSFIEAICTAADDPQEPVRVVFTVRDDFLGRLAVTSEAREALAHVTLVQRLESDALVEVLEKPIAAVGYGFEDADLPKEMVRAVEGEPAGLPLLQFAAQLLWEQRDTERRLLLRSAYTKMGGVEGALAKHADGVLASLSQAEVRMARAVLLRLVTPDRRRRALARDRLLAELAGVEGDAEAVLTRLIQARLVTVTRSTDPDERAGSSLELAHESLIARWATLERWVDESKEELAFVAEVGQAAELWNRRGRREEELWQREALDEALRFVARIGIELPELPSAFLAAAEQRKARAQRRTRALIAAAMVGLAGIAVVLAFQKLYADKQRAAAEEREREADEQRAEALREGAASARAQGDFIEARAKLRLALERKDTTAARALWWQLRGNVLEWQAELGAVIYATTLSHDGRTIAVGCQDRAVYLLDAHTAAQRVLRGHRDQVTTVALSRDGKLLASGALSGELILWDVASGALLKRIEAHTAGIYGLSFSPDGTMLATSSADERLRLWKVPAGSARPTSKGDAGWLAGASFSPDGKLVAAGGRDGRVLIWDTHSGAVKGALSGHEAWVEDVAFSPQGDKLASASSDGTVRIWNVADRKLSRKLEGHRDRVRSVSFSHDGRLVASASHDRSVIVWDAASGALRHRLEGHTDVVRAVSFSGQGPVLVSGGIDKMVKLWHLGGEGSQTPLEGHAGGVYGVSFHPDGKLVASAGDDRTVRLWDVSSGEERAVLRGHGAVVNGVAFSPDGKQIASASADRTIRLWSVASGREERTLSGHEATVNGLAFSPRGDVLASTSIDGTVRIWEVPSGRERDVLRGHTGTVMRASFSPDGALLATSSFDGTVRVWDLATKTARHVAKGHKDRVFGVSFSPDGHQVASGGFDRALRLLDVDSGKEQELAAFSARIHEVAFDPQGEHIAAASSDGSLVLWNRSKASSVTIAAHTTEVNAVSFDADGKLIATAGDDGTVKLSDAKSGRPFWRAPALLRAPARLLTHRGWRALEGGKPQVPSHVREALERRARHAIHGVDGLLCVQTFDNVVEIWDLENDRLTHERPITGLSQIAAVKNGCAVRADGAVRIYSRDGAVKQLALQGEASAMAWSDGAMLVAADDNILVFDESGQERARVRSGVGVTALGLIESVVAAGYADGNVELFSIDEAAKKPSSMFESVPSSPVVGLAAGPRDSLIIGYANGVVGLWSLHDGTRLAHVRLHGSIAHLLLENHELHIASTLGRHFSWDLSPFYADRCALLAQVWEEVPVIWQNGRAVEAPPPADHPCR